MLQHLAALTSLPCGVARTCPGYYCTTPLSVAARVWRGRGEKRGVRLGVMPAGIVPAVEALDAAIDARQAHDHEQNKRRMDAQRAEAESRRGER